MKRWRLILWVTTAIFLTLPLAVARAEYSRPSASGKDAVSFENGSFEEAVNLKRFRKGNIDWDTQELIVSGLTALHREHVQVLRELAELKAAVERLEAER